MKQSLCKWVEIMKKKKWFGYDPETHQVYLFGMAIAGPHEVGCSCKECAYFRLRIEIACRAGVPTHKDCLCNTTTEIKLLDA